MTVSRADSAGDSAGVRGKSEKGTEPREVCANECKVDEWSGLADFLANMIEKYASELNLDSLQDPDHFYRKQQMMDMYRRYMRVSAKSRKAA